MPLKPQATETSRTSTDNCGRLLDPAASSSVISQVRRIGSRGVAAVPMNCRTVVGWGDTHDSTGKGKHMSGIQAISASSAQSVAWQDHIAASRTDAARAAQNMAKTQSTSAEEASESAAERAAEASSASSGQSLNVVA